MLLPNVTVFAQSPVKFVTKGNKTNINNKCNHVTKGNNKSMAIDITSIRLYTCCDCGRQWTNWDGVNKREGKTPLNCPSCKTIRWNQNYVDEERVLINQLNDEHLIRKDAQTERVKSRYRPYNVYETTYSYFDFIAYDFLYRMTPSPDLFELKQVVEIPLTSNNEEMERRRRSHAFDDKG